MFFNRLKENTICFCQKKSEIVNFYRNFHSYRFVGDKLVVRLQDAIDPDAFDNLATEFADIVKSGTMQQRGALPEEENEVEMAEMPRIVLRHGRGDMGRLRQFIDAINVATIV